MNIVNGVYAVILFRSWKTAMLRTIQTVEAHLKRLLRGILLPGELETILVIFWQSLAACCLCPKNPVGEF